MDAEAATGHDQLSVILLGRWAATPEQESPLQLPGATLWRAPLDLHALHDLAIRVAASWLLVGEGIDDEVLLKAGSAFKQLMPAVRHAYLGPADDVDRCEAWLRRGASVYFAMPAPVQRVIGALAASVALNALVIDECFQAADIFRRTQTIGGLPGVGASLSARESDVLRLIRRGLSNAEIANALSITENTVQHHISRLYRKLGATSRTQAIEKARALGL